MRVRRGETELDPGSPQQRALLCALLLREGRTAMAHELVDAVWEGEPPARALAALRTYASRLRKALGQDTLVTDAGGYAVRISEDAIDLVVCERLVTAADRARHTGDLRRARELLLEALSLWSGEPLAGVPGPYAHTHRTRLVEWRVRLRETELELDLDLGRHAEAVSELTVLAAEHPLRERLRCLLMLALYRSGRQAEALGVYADARRLLNEELGVEPGPELTELHQRVLRADPELTPPEGGEACSHHTGTPTIRPAQLPASVADFTGRDNLVHELSEQLSAREGTVMAVSAVAGIGGVGKTTLAVHVAHAAREHFPDGQLYVDLQGAGPRPTEPVAVLGAFLRALGTQEATIPDGLAERAAFYRSALAGRRVLALLDNARDVAQVTPLLPGSPGCAVVITSRAKMLGLAGAHLVDLDVMSPEEAIVLFGRIVGWDRVQAERQVSLDVVAACGFLPLAIRIAAARLASRRTWTVAVLAGKLADERRRLDELRVGELAITATFELGYGQLEPDQARVFRLLALAEGPDVSLPAVAALLDMSEHTAEEAVESLVDTSLLESAAPGRYRYHDLLRLFARDRAERDESPRERQEALSRLLDFYLATASHAYALENPGDRLLDHLTATRGKGLVFQEGKKALDWLFAEAACLLATISQTAAEDELLRGAADLLLVSQDLMESGAYARQYEQATQAVVKAARERGDTRSEGRARAVLGQAHCLTGQFDTADSESEHALTLGRAASDPVTSAYAPNLRGMVALYHRRYQDAEEYFAQALQAFQADGNRQGEGSALSNLSRALLALGQADRAVEAAEQGLALYRELGVTLRLGNGLYALGLALAEANRIDEAIRSQREALAVFRENRQRLWEGMTVYRLAEVMLLDSRPAEAASYADQALVLLRELGGEWRRGNVLTVLGRALGEIGEVDRARACWRQALELFEKLAAPEAGDVRKLLGEQAVATRLGMS